ncbi:MAG: CHAT domain-containing protein [Cyanobacteria bacterium P01_F01_bin.116]
MRFNCRYQRQLFFTIWVVLGFTICWIGSGQTPALSASTTEPSVIIQHTEQTDASTAEKRGSDLYGAGQYRVAITTWQQALQIYQTQSNTWGQARILCNLALAYQQIGQRSDAAQAMDGSLELLSSTADVPKTQLPSYAQVLTNQGNFQLNQGQAEEALLHWQEAEKIYQQIGHTTGIVQSQLNQSQALHELGFYRRAVDKLVGVQEDLLHQPESELHVITLRHLGNLLRVVGQLSQSRQALSQSLTIAKTLQLTEETGETLISLGKTTQAQQDWTTAEGYYQEADKLSLSLETQLRNQLAKLDLWLATGQREQAEVIGKTIVNQLEELPISHTTIYGRIHLVQNLTQLYRDYADTASPNWTSLAQIVAKATQDAQAIGDQRAEAYALGQLGNVYEQTKRWDEAVDLTHQALNLAQSLNALDIVYQWQWQLGRILKQQGMRGDAIAAYASSVDILKTLRGDLVAVSADLQFSFKESIEPIYRELVDLLLQPEFYQTVDETHLEQARTVIESLQLAELDNFFKEACMDVHPIQIDKIDPQAAIFYPILLGDRLEVVLRLPNQPLHHYSTNVSNTEIESLTQQLRESLVIRSRRNYLPLSQQLYDWLIRPVARDLKASGVTTLVFVPDRPLQAIPMGALHDGEHFLIEDYNIALTPGLQLLSPQPISRKNIQILAAGLTEGRQGFAPLSHVASEMDAIQTNIPKGEVLLDQAFTRDSLKKELQSSSFPIIHIATHGQFSSAAEDTFILSWDNRINVTEIDQALQTNSLNGDTAIELLVLSACETAKGDKQAALGIAGTAVRAGARSTLATLWSVNDEATAKLIGHFYEALINTDFTRSEALRQAQLKLLQDPQYRHPIYWAPYVLLGNWL